RRAMGGQRPQLELPPLDLPHLAAVVERLGRAAQAGGGADQRVSHLMVLGRLRDAQGTPALAAEAYQQVLSEPVLANANWRGSGASVRAELEATRRIRQLLLDRGPTAYAVFEAEAAHPPPSAGPCSSAGDLGA